MRNPTIHTMRGGVRAPYSLKVIEERDQAWQRLATCTTVVAAAVGIMIGGLCGWNLHETSDVHANYVAGLPTCEGAGND